MTLKDIYQSITKSEWKLCWYLSAFIIIISTLPVIYGFFHTPDNRALTGIHALTPIDMNVYYSYIEQVKQGRNLFVNLFTSEKQTLPILNILWLAVGWLGKIFNLNSIATFHLARILLIPALVGAVYLLIAYFFTEKNKRTTALLFILFSAGIGAWLIPLLQPISFVAYGYYHWPMDLWVAESFTFLTLFHTPHFIASLILIILIFLFVLLAWENNKLSYEIYAGLASLLLFQFHPFHLPTIFGVLGVYWAWLCFVNNKILWRKLRPIIMVFLFTLPDLLYHFYTLTDPLIKQRAIQNVCLTPVWWLSIIGFGFLVPLSIIGSYYIIKQEKKYKTFNKYHFLVCWLIIQTLLIYSPSPLQRRMSEGLQIVLSLLTVIALFAILEKIKNKPTNKLNKIILKIYNNKFLLLFIFIIFFTYSNLFNVIRDFTLYQNTDNYIFYMTKEDEQAFEWIKNNTASNSAFLAHPHKNNLIAGHTGRFVYAGHTTETYFYHAKESQITRFFISNIKDKDKKQFLQDNNITHIYYSDAEQVYNSNHKGFKPEEKDYLKLVYGNNLVRIYEISSY